MDRVNPANAADVLTDLPPWRAQWVTTKANAWVGPEPRPDLQGDGGMHFESLQALKFRDVSTLDFRPADGSPLIDAGIRISSEPSATDRAQGRPDIGVFEHGRYDQPMPGDTWPRPRKRVFNAAPPEQITGKAVEPQLVDPNE